MTRPTDWYLVDQPEDPTPGDSWGVKQLANEYGNIATVAGEVAKIVKLVKSTSATGIWIGAAGDSFRQKLDTLPDDAAKCAKSYGIARDAMNYWASQMTEHQTKADTNLTKARLAQADLDAAKASLASAMVTQATASDAYTRTNDLVEQYKNTTPPPEVKVPAPWEVQRAKNANANAQAAVATANQQITNAQALLDAAKRGAADAKADYDNAARTVVTKLQSAKDAGVRADTWWEAIYHSDGWKVFIAIVNVVVTVLAIVAMFTPLGPLLAAILLVGSALLLLDTLAAFAEGEASPADLAIMLAATFVPGGRGAVAGARGLSAGVHMAEGAAGVAGMAGKGAKVADELAATTKSLRDPRLDTITEKLTQLTRDKAAAFDNGKLPLSARQRRAIERNPNLEHAFRGTAIDKAVKDAVGKNPIDPGLQTTGPFKYGPDFHIDINGQKTWWDMTTPGQWKGHGKYTIDNGPGKPSFGDGIPLYTK